MWKTEAQKRYDAMLVEMADVIKGKCYGDWPRELQVAAHEATVSHYRVEEAERNAVATKWGNRFMAAFNRAMAKAGVAAPVMVQSANVQSNWGDYSGYWVYAGTAELAERAAAWCVKWDQKDYEAKGGKYGGCTYDAQHVYRVDGPAKEHAPGIWKVFANCRYHSIGD